METQYKQTIRPVNEDSVARRSALFDLYVLPHKNLIYKLCIKYTSNSNDIEDNYNEVLTNFWKYIETYDPGKSIQTWLHIVTKRYIVDANNKRNVFQRSEDLDVADLRDTYLGDDNEVSANCMSLDNYKQFYNDDVLEALGSLKDIYREALLLQLSGYKLHEIMEITFKSGSLKTKNIETVKSRLFLAKQQMRDLITRDGEKRTN